MDDWIIYAIAWAGTCIAGLVFMYCAATLGGEDE